MPQAIRWVCPMITPGTPENVKPATSNGQAADSVRQCRPIWYQMPGMPGARCGSLASSGLPVVVSEPATTQEFEPTPSPEPSRSGTAETARCAASRVCWAGADSRSATRASASLDGRGAARCRTDGTAMPLVLGDGLGDGAVPDRRASFSPP